MCVCLCVAQIVLFSGKVETQHSSPEVWLPGERGGKKRGKTERELHRCGERETEKKDERKEHEILGMRAGERELETERDQEMNTEIGRKSLRKNKQREAQIWFKSHKTPKMDDQSVTILNKFQNVLHAMLVTCGL